MPRFRSLAAEPMRLNSLNKGAGYVIEADGASE
jgi:hypothetical protein